GARRGAWRATLRARRGTPSTRRARSTPAPAYDELRTGTSPSTPILSLRGRSSAFNENLVRTTPRSVDLFVERSSSAAACGGRTRRSLTVEGRELEVGSTRQRSLRSTFVPCLGQARLD